MVEIAAPISHLFDDEQTAHQIIGASDCLECRDSSVDFQWPGQKLMHFKGSLIWPWSEAEKEFIKGAVSKKLELELATFHLDSCYDSPIIVDKMYQPGGNLHSRDELLKHAETNTKWFRSVFGEGILIGVENNNYFPTPAYKIVTDGKFVSDVVGSNGLEFLLDLAHAKITAHNKKISYLDYLTSLPLDKVIQVHASKHFVDGNGRAHDVHDVPDDAIYQEVEKLLKKFPIKYVAIEYYQDGQKLIESLQNFSRLKTV